MAHIEVEKVCKIINKSIVLENINLDMSSGKVYGFQGINGSGKTMLMRALIGLIRPTSGKVCIDGKELGKDIDFPERYRIFTGKFLLFWICIPERII